jgi:hypothetical protein
VYRRLVSDPLKVPQILSYPEDMLEKISRPLEGTGREKKIISD